MTQFDVISPRFDVIPLGPRSHKPIPENDLRTGVELDFLENDVTIVVTIDVIVDAIHGQKRSQQAITHQMFWLHSFLGQLLPQRGEGRLLALRASAFAYKAAALVTASALAPRASALALGAPPFAPGTSPPCAWSSPHCARGSPGSPSDFGSSGLSKEPGARRYLREISGLAGSIATPKMT